MDRALALVVLTTALGLTPAAAQDLSVLRKPLLGKPPPELAAAGDDWLVGPAVTLDILRGRVVWLQFNRSETCVSFRSHLLKWEDEFRQHGLMIVEVSGDGSTDIATSRQRLDQWSVRHPVLWDRNGHNMKAYAISAWPTAYLIGRDGKVFWQGNPAMLLGRKDDEAAFRANLTRQLEIANVFERKPKCPQPQTSSPVDECFGRLQPSRSRRSGYLPACSHFDCDGKLLSVSSGF